MSAPEASGSEQISMTDVGSGEVCRLLRRTDLDTLTPIEAFNLLYELKKKVEE